MQKRIEVRITEKDKGTRDLSLLNLREEIVNFLYKDTIANSTKADLQFFVLLYFAAIPVGKTSFLEKILDEGIPKFDRLNEAFSQHTGYLRAREYRAMVEQYGLSELFEKDIFFVLIESVLNIDTIEPRFASFYQGYDELNSVITRVKTTYSEQLRAGLSKFESSRIRDDRYDEFGNYHDLSKSVYRTVRMRNARNLDLNLQKYTSIRKLTSRSPIDLSFIQFVDPQIIFDLWDKYHVVDYMKSIWRAADSSAIVSGMVSGVMVELITKFAEWKSTNGATNRKEKEIAKQGFEQAKKEDDKVLDDLTLRLVDSVLQANERLIKELDETRRQLRDISSKQPMLQDRELIKRLEERLARLENLEVTARIIEETEEVTEEEYYESRTNL